MQLAAHLRIALPSLVLIATSCSATQVTAHENPSASPHAHEHAAQSTLLPPARGPLDVSVAGGGALTLADLLGRLSKSTGVTFSTQDLVDAQLKRTTVVLSDSKSVPAADVYPWVEAVLLQHGCSLGVLHGGESPLVGVYIATIPGSARPDAVSIEPEQIGECRVHPALLFMTVVHLPHTDVRTLGNSMRGITSDPASPQGLLPVGNTNSVIVQGTGQHVADLVAMLQAIDGNSARDIAPSGPAAAQAAAPQKQ